jgi:hypothetical protein
MVEAPARLCFLDLAQSLLGLDNLDPCILAACGQPHELPEVRLGGPDIARRLSGLGRAVLDRNRLGACLSDVS